MRCRDRGSGEGSGEKYLQPSSSPHVSTRAPSWSPRLLCPQSLIPTGDLMRRRVLLALALVLLASSARAALDPGLLAGMSARSIGPAGMSGRVPAVAAVESNPSLVYAGGAAGGVWKSTNGGLTRAPVFGDPGGSSVGVLAGGPPKPGGGWGGAGEGKPRNRNPGGD